MKNEDKPFNKSKRFISIFLSLFIIIFVISWLMSLVIPELINVIKNFIQYLSRLPIEIKPYIDEMANSANKFEHHKEEIDWNSYFQKPEDIKL